VIAYIAARAGGTAYTAAKAIEIGAPLAALTIVLPLTRDGVWRLSRSITDKSATPAPGSLVGVRPRRALPPRRRRLLDPQRSPTRRSGRPTTRRRSPGSGQLVANGSTVVLASHTLLADQHGTPYIAWELRGGRVCIETREEAAGQPPPGSVMSSPAAPSASRRSRACGSAKWHRPTSSGKRRGRSGGQSPCPLIAVRQARQGPAR